MEASPSTPFRGRTALVTGGATGIGRACAEWIARRGAKVWSADFDYPDGSKTELASLGIEPLDCDVRVEVQVERCVAAAVQATGRLDILVNSAGVAGVGRITEVSEELWDRCLDTNLKGAFLFSKHAIRRMAGHGGVIVNIASNAGIAPRVHDPTYCVSKAGLIMLTRALALAHAPDRIRVNAVCPGPVQDTRMMDRDLESAADPDAFRAAVIAASPLAQAFGRMAHPREIAEAVGYLVSDAAVMVTGTLLAIDGGKSIGVPPRVS